MTRIGKSIILVLFACGWAAPQAPAQSANLARQLAPVISPDTLAVVKIDMTRIDVDALAQMAVETSVAGMNTQQMERLGDAVQRQSQAWRRHIARFEEAGGKSLFIIVNQTDILLAVPLTSSLDEPAMKAWFDSLDDRSMVSARKGELLVAARPWILNQRKGDPPMPREELRLAAGKATPAPVQVFLIPTADSRRVLEAMLPSMLGPGVDLRNGALVDGHQWATVGLGLSPQSSLTVHVESANAEAASALRDFFIQALRFLFEVPALKNASGDIQDSVARLTPQVSESSLKLTLDTKQFDRVASRLLTPGLFALRESILRVRCGTTLSGMGRAMLIYANDYEDQWPPSLETLVQTVEYNPSGLVCPALRHRPDYESYVYRGVDTGGTSVEPMIIMVHDRAGNHEGGRNVLFVDSHVEWVTEERFQELIQQDNELRAKRGLPVKPAQ